MRLSYMLARTITEWRLWARDVLRRAGTPPEPPTVPRPRPGGDRLPTWASADDILNLREWTRLDEPHQPHPGPANGGRVTDPTGWINEAHRNRRPF